MVAKKRPAPNNKKAELDARKVSKKSTPKNDEKEAKRSHEIEAPAKSVKRRRKHTNNDSEKTLFLESQDFFSMQVWRFADSLHLTN